MALFKHTISTYCALLSLSLSISNLCISWNDERTSKGDTVTKPRYYVTANYEGGKETIVRPQSVLAGLGNRGSVA